MPLLLLSRKSLAHLCAHITISFLSFALFAIAPGAAAQPVAVLTQHNDNARTGDNLAETTLSVTNVNTNSFGLLYSRPVDDQIYAQPLIMTNVNIPGVGPRNLLIVATVNDTVYAYDADDPSVVAPYWTNSFVQPPNIVPVSVIDEDAVGACGGFYQDYGGNFGIVGTPVIDPVSGTIYCVARTREISGGQTNFVQRLHALDPTTGLDRPNSPVTINATFPGSGYGSISGVLTFEPLRHNQRPALLLVNGIVYICWASHCDNEPYHGWVMGYNATTLQQSVVFVNTPDGVDGGIWMSGQGPSADTNGNIYLSAGNGSADATDFGESFVKLTNDNSGTLKVASFFLPRDFVILDTQDADLGSAGLLLVPGTTLAVSGGKSGVLYLVNRDNMGGFTPTGKPSPRIVQSWNLRHREIHGAPVWWKSTSGSYMYIWAASQDHLRQYHFSGGHFGAFAQSKTIGGAGSPGGILSVSANGTNVGTGILWAVVNDSDASDAHQSIAPGTLHAYDAHKVSRELWNSDMIPGDALGTLAKFVPPTIANGKVYMATFDGRVQVYGLH
jgi:hypothetical protein